MRMSKLILVVEDNAATRAALKALLEGAGYPVACAANGRDALDYLRGSHSPGLILLDLSMPVMDGWTFRRHQRHTPGLDAIPVIVLSAEADLPRQAASLAVASYLPKPVEFGALLDAIRLVSGDGPPAGEVGSLNLNSRHEMRPSRVGKSA